MTSIEREDDNRKPTATSELMPKMAQENLLSILAQDPEHGKLVTALVRPEYFEGDYRVMAERFINYWRRYNRPPGVHSPDLFADIIENSSSRKGALLRRTLTGLAGLAEHVNTEYVLQECQKFIRNQELKDGVIRAAQTLSNGAADHEQVEKIFSDLLRTHSHTFDPGLRGGNVDSLRQHLAKREENEFVTGIIELDRHHVVPTRGTIMILLGVTGQGKSWFLTHVGAQALQQRKKVLHVSLEMSENDVQLRYYQNFLAAPVRDDEIESTRTRLELDADNKLIGLERESVAAASSMRSYDPRKLEKFGARPILNNLIIKKFPMRGLSVTQLDGYLTGLEQAHNFMPDLLLLDYVGVMKTDSDNYRITLGRVLEELHGLATERKLALVTAQQVNREGKRAAQVDLSHVAEDWSLTNTADFVLTLTRNETEEAHGIGRLWVSKDRHGVQNFGVVLSQNYQHGQFMRESAALDRKGYQEMLDELAEMPARRKSSGKA